MMNDGNDKHMRRRGKYFNRQKEYIAGLDGLRAIAVLMVFAYHLRMPFAKGGLLGVTVFFVLSGFLITRILVSELEENNTIDLAKFWVRRIRRLLPAILVMVTALTFVSAVFNRVLFTKFCADLPSAIFCYNNWWQIFNHISYFENVGAPSPLTHCWSLAIEAQFYLVYPLVLIFLKRFPNWKKIAAGVTLVSALISMAAMWRLFDPSKDASRVYYGTDTRVFSLLFGAFLVLVLTNRRKKRDIDSILREIIGIVSFAELLYMMAKLDGYQEFLYRGGQGFASVCTVLVIFSLLEGEGILSRLLNIPVLKWIGDRSYGIYLWHYPVILLVSNGIRAAWWVNVLEVMATCIIADLSYRFIETPIRHGVIGRSIEVLRRRPRTLRERREQLRTQRHSMRAAAFSLTLAAGVLLCVAFVPRKSVLSDVENLEKQAEQAREIAQQKAMGLKKTAMKVNRQERKEDTRTDEEILDSLNLLLIGDSVALGASNRLYEEFSGIISDVAVSRQTTESIGIYDAYANGKGWDGDGVIFALGSNGLLYDSLPTIREMIGEDRPLFIFTVRAPHVSWEETNNQEIYNFVEAAENTYLIDWYKISDGHGEYFAKDGTHLTSKGIDAYVAGVKEAVLAVYR